MDNNKKEIYLKILADKIQNEIPDALFPATVTLKFNDPLLEDTDGRYAIFYADRFNTIEAEEVQSGNTHAEEDGITFNLNVPKWGVDLAFVGIGLGIAQYCGSTATIMPGENTVYLIAAYETNFGEWDDDDDFGNDDDDTTHPNYFLRSIQNIA